nr:iron chelate uptake ABC transporter family permease subunit [Kibdelosporangium sp. MJ126-NF4]CEL18343.1 ABC-type Fe3+-siderophore transport system, permease component [Kibdelosporangium sp. MJ126-NF4]CTQ97828.1 ABC-type Fe3+-siderophore transport system, permease component [Kibdelosporangium sp. MJ126-NF4]
MNASRTAILAGFVVVLGAVAVVSMGVGAQALAPAEVWRALVSPGADAADIIVRDVRLPRMILALAVGAALAVAGALLQTATRNDLADPGILSVTAGAGFAITVGTVLGLTGTQVGQLIAAVVGAAAATVVVYAVGRTSPLRLLLAGFAFSMVLAGLSLGLRLTLPDAFDRFRFWAVGSLAGREQVPLTAPVVIMVLALVGALMVARQLEALLLGEDVAQSLGVNVARTRLAVLVLVTLLAGTATAVVGPMVFVGLVIPHLARPFAGNSIPWLIGFTIVLGPILMLAADIAARVLLRTGEMPVSIVIAVFGGPVLIWVIRRKRTAPL